MDLDETVQATGPIKLAIALPVHHLRRLGTAELEGRLRRRSKTIQAWR